MTTPIKPPSGPTAAAIASTLPDTDKLSEASRAGFREELEATHATASTSIEGDGATTTAGAGGIGGPDPITEALRQGQISPAEAVNAMVQRALDSPLARTLAPNARAKLESALRTQLADDPALRSLVGDLDRAR